jgi:cyclophilin family peptidyl-prolyl cis-trans isomerase
MSGRFLTIAVLTAVLMVMATGCAEKDTASDDSGTEVETKPAQVQTDKPEAEAKPAQVQVNKPKTGVKMVKLETSMGDIVLELNEEKAPVTVKNFLRYVEEGYFDDTIFHRVISGFMVQGGGFSVDHKQKDTHETIVNEAKNGLKNFRGTVAMARMPDPDSASSQFFINHRDNNESLDYGGPAGAGYTVFGKVTDGMDVVDKIAAVKTGTRTMTMLTSRGGKKVEMSQPFQDVPVEPVVIKSATVISE